MNSRRWRCGSDPQAGGIISSLISLAFLVVLCGALYLARHPILRFVGEGWVIEDPMDHADAIIVLSDDNFYADRATRAAELYRQGMAPIVVASGRKLRPYAGIAELMEHDLLERGVPKEKIIRVAHNADNTKDEAKVLAQLTLERRWHSVIVVTSNYHTRRARYIFQRVLPAGVAVHVAGARDAGFDPERWWEARKSLKEFVREVAGMIVALWEVSAKDRASMKTPLVVGENGFAPQHLV